MTRQTSSSPTRSPGIKQSSSTRSSPTASRRLSSGKKPRPPATPDGQKSFTESILQSEGIVALANATGIENSKIVGGIVLILVMLFFGVGGNVVCNGLGFVYPMYKSFQAIEVTGLGVHQTDREVDEEDLRRCVHLLMYWVVYTFFTLGEYFSDILLFWVPFYYPLKLALLIWCLKYDGAQTLYSTTFGKLLKQYEPRIDQLSELGEKYAGKFAEDVKQGGRGLVKQHSASIAGGAASVFSAVQRNVADASKSKSESKSK